MNLWSPSVVARLKILAAALLFSTGGAAIKSCALTNWQVASFRCGVAALAMLVILPQARRRWSPRALAVGVAYATTLTFYVLANKATTAANAIFLQSTAPLYILLLAPLLLAESIRRRDLFLMAGIAAGMAMFFIGHEAPTETAPDPTQGNLLAAAAGLSWALTVIGLRWLGRAENSTGQAVVAVVAGNCLGLIVGLPMALPVVSSQASDWILVLYLGIFQVAVAYALLTSGLERVGAFEASLLLLIEPMLNPLWAWWIHGEVPGAWSLAGGITVLTVTVTKTWLDSARSEPAESGAVDSG